MRRKKRPFKLVPLFVLTFFALLHLTNTYPPSHVFHITNYQVPITYVFFTLLFLFSSSFLSFLLNNIRRGFFVGTTVTAYLLLRFFGLTHPLFTLTLLAIFLALELVFTRKHH